MKSNAKFYRNLFHAKEQKKFLVNSCIRCSLHRHISGVTCGGKTTITKLLQDCLGDSANKNILNDNITIKSVKMVSQDDYFWPVDSPHHKVCGHLNHINWEIISAMDMDRMCNDLKELIGHESNLYRRQSSNVPMDLNILIIEGFLIFNHPAIFDLCQIKFHLHLPYEECYKRRSNRVYDPPDIVGYFEGYVWPLYEKHFRKFSESGEVIMLNGSMSMIPKEKHRKCGMNVKCNFIKLFEARLGVTGPA